MKFLIAPATPSFIDTCGSEGLFTDVKGRKFLYEIDYEENEMIRISDSVGRMVPLDIDEVTALAEVLCRIVRYQDTKEAMQLILLNELVGGENNLP